MYGCSGKLGRGRGGGVPVKRTMHSTFQPSSVQRPSATVTGGRLSASGGNRNRNNTSGNTAAATVSTADENFSLVCNSPLNFGMIIRLAPNLIEEIKRVEAQGGAAKIKFDSCANIPDGNVIDVGGKEYRFTWSRETGDLCDIYEERESGDNGDGLLVEAGGAWRRVNVHRELDASFTNHVKMRTVEADPKHKSRKAIVLDHGNPSMKNQMKALVATEVNSSWKGSFKQNKKPPFKNMKAEPSSAIVPPKSGGKTGFSSSTPSKVRASASPLLSTPEQSGVPVSPLKNSNVTKIHTIREDFTSSQSGKDNAGTSVKEMLSRVPAGVLQNKPGNNERFGNKPIDLQSLLISLLTEKPQGMNLKALEKAVGETIPISVKQIEPILKKIAVQQAPGRYILKPEVDLESSKRTLYESGSSPENNNHNREATALESSFALKPDDVKEFEQPFHLISEPHEDINTSEKNKIDHCSPDILSEKKVSENIEGPAVTSSASGSDSDSSDSSDSGSDSRSSESESDASSNSKQGSDEDVDIMSDDDNEHKQTVQQSDHEVAYAHNNAVDGHGSDLLDLEKDLFGDDIEGDIHIANKDDDNYADETTNLFNNHLDHQHIEVHDHARKTVSKSTSKRGSDEKDFDDNEHAKRLKSGNCARPDGPSEGPYKGITNQMMGRTVRDVSDYDYEKPDNREFFINSTSDSPKSGQRSIDLNARAKPPSERGPQGNDLFFTQRDKANKETRNEDSHSKDRRPPKNSRGKHSGSHQKKHGASIGKIKDSGVVSASQFKDSPIDFKTSPLINVTNGRGPTLRRELSDLEMGELRENLHEEASGGKKRFERNNSLKQVDNKSSSDYWNLDESKGKPAGRSSLDSAKPSPLKKVVPDDHFDDFTRLNDKPVSRLDPVKGGLHHSKGRDNETGASQRFGSEKAHVGPPHKHEKQVPITTKDKKRRKSKDLGEKKKDFWVVDKRREMESCSDDSIISYTKYEKDEPEMKGPIRDLSQYNEYVQEYREKYDCYNTLNKILETYRNEFQTFARDLELAKGKDNDRYSKILEQLMESYRQCGMKHKRLKKIFVVLHHELQHLKEMIRDFAEKQTKG